MNGATRQRVTIDNFRQAESHFFMKQRVEAGMFGKLVPLKTFVSADDQKVVRSNHDMLFTYGLFDLTTPVTITLAETGARYLSMRVINEHHYIKLLTYKPGSYLLDREMIGSRYVYVAIRLLANPNDPEDVAAANASQDEMSFSQAESGVFETPEWDAVSQAQVRKGLQILASTLQDAEHAFGDEHEVEPLRHLIGTAAGWGGGPTHDATYLNVTPLHNDGVTPYVLNVGEVPVDAFWSITVYNEAGYFEKNPMDLYSIDNISAQKNADGTITIHFGGHESQANFLPVTKGWNYTVRMYKPRPSVLDGSWKFPQATPIL